MALKYPITSKPLIKINKTKTHQAKRNLSNKVKAFTQANEPPKPRNQIQGRKSSKQSINENTHKHSLKQEMKSLENARKKIGGERGGTL
jgi:hypothetical protein